MGGHGELLKKSNELRPSLQARLSHLSPSTSRPVRNTARINFGLYQKVNGTHRNRCEHLIIDNIDWNNPSDHSKVRNIMTTWFPGWDIQGYCLPDDSTG